MAHQTKSRNSRSRNRKKRKEQFHVAGTDSNSSLNSLNKNKVHTNHNNSQNHYVPPPRHRKKYFHQNFQNTKNSNDHQNQSETVPINSNTEHFPLNNNNKNINNLNDNDTTYNNNYYYYQQKENDIGSNSNSNLISNTNSISGSHSHAELAEYNDDLNGMSYYNTPNLIPINQQNNQQQPPLNNMNYNNNNCLFQPQQMMNNIPLNPVMPYLNINLNQNELINQNQIQNPNLFNNFSPNQFPPLNIHQNHQTQVQNNQYPLFPSLPFQETYQEPIASDYLVSIDVECAAIGHGHFDSSPCRIAMVDFFGNTLFDLIIRVENMLDPLTEFTGLTKDEINTKGCTIEHALNKLHSMLIDLQDKYKYGVTVVGQSLINDIVWSQLKKGIHYNKLIDIAVLYRTKSYDKYYYYSLRQEAFALLGITLNDQYHDPCEDALISIELYKYYINNNPEIINYGKEKLKHMRIMKLFPDFKVNCKFTQCSSGMYTPEFCKCGQESVKSIEDIEVFRKLVQKYRKIPVLTVWS